MVVTYCNATDYPFRNVSLPFSERVKVSYHNYLFVIVTFSVHECLFLHQDLVDRLTLDELIGQMAHGGAVKNG